MITYTWEHIHLRSPDPEATAAWYQRILNAEVIRTPQTGGATRIDLTLGGGQKVFIATANPALTTAAPPQTPDSASNTSASPSPTSMPPPPN